jgi:spoIIIJ-associated protein
MEWVETTAKTVAEAKDLALDKLGVDEADAEFDVVEEPRQGLFGRTRGEARVRARVVPKAPRAKDDSRDRRRRNKSGSRRGPAKSGAGKSGAGSSDTAVVAESGEESGPTGEASSSGGDQGRRGQRQEKPQASGGGQKRDTPRSKRQPADRPRKEDAPMEDVRSSVEDFLTGLTAAFGIDTTVEIEADEEQILASIQGKHGLLLGPKARTLDAIQELTRVTAQRAAPSSIRIKVDVGGYREARKAALAKFASEAAAKAIEEGVEVVLEPMSSADRKVVHDALNDVEGVTTRSAGSDPRRFVVVVPDGQGAGADD